MTQSTRRAGFRLPWSSESDDAPDATASQDAAERTDATTATADPAAAAPDAATSKGDAPVGEGETVVADIDPTASGAPGARVTAADNGTTTPETPAASPPAASPPAAEPTVEMHAEAAADLDESDFLRSLVDAMRGVAEEERTASVAELRRLVDERVALLETRAKDRVEELRRTSELDVTGVGDWATGEIERVNAEASRKVEARRKQLEEQLSDHETRSTAEVTSVRERVAAYEQELEAFFNQLGSITDPASFVAAARRMPRAPSLEGSSATPASTATPTPTASLNARLAQLGIDRAAKPIPTPAAAPAAAPETPAAGPATDSASAGESTAAVVESPAALAETPAAAQATAPAGERDAQLAERLAELDAHQEPNTATTQTGTGDDADEIATAIMVKGLGSFGAITSFKQRLERLATVRSVTLSLGPTGEFVYRATHPRQIDLGGAIATLEPGSTVDRQADGSLRVTVQPR